MIARRRVARTPRQPYTGYCARQSRSHERPLPCFHAERCHAQPRIRGRSKRAGRGFICHAAPASAIHVRCQCRVSAQMPRQLRTRRAHAQRARRAHAEPAAHCRHTPDTPCIDAELTLHYAVAPATRAAEAAEYADRYASRQCRQCRACQRARCFVGRIDALISGCQQRGFSVAAARMAEPRLLPAQARRASARCAFYAPRCRG